MSRFQFYAVPFAAMVLLLLLCLPETLSPVLAALFPHIEERLFPRSPLYSLLFQHLLISLTAAVIAAVIGVLLAVAATRRRGRAFLPLIRDASSLAQTIPPIAVLALAIPFLGFGFKPVLLALVLYSILPVLNNTLSALETLPKAILEAAAGMGMNQLQSFLRVELPLALPMTGAGIRTSTVLNIGTAAIAALAGAGGLGSPIAAGLIRDNPAWVFQGAVATALLALTVNAILLRVEMKLRAK
ncbi:MAG: hypothetical protein B0D92_05450 [Spirochaeta sp. LUC14_002_19_P3]|nr:MAG: hypothetical protein B0D92_05450 [Spirochaeta sp. LUC14_002_19_P3]